jgi:ABC-2 type transport system permease protein
VSGPRVVRAVIRKSLLTSRRQPTATIMSIVIPLNFLIISSLFALGGGTVSVAVVSHDAGPYAQAFVRSLDNSFTYKVLMVSNQSTADSMLNSGTIIGVVTIPSNFDSSISAHQNASVSLLVNNYDSDSLDDVLRGTSVTSYGFYSSVNSSALSAKISEQFTYPSTVGFVQYIGVAVLGIALFLGGLIYGGQISSREFEQRTIKELLLAPVEEYLILGGQAIGSAISSAIAGLLVAAVIILLFGIVPLYPVYLIATFLLALVISNSLGVLFGILLKRLQFIAPLSIGLALPLFLISGVFGPESYSVPGVALVAQILPGYYIVGLLEFAFNGVNPTPYPVYVLVGILALQATVAIVLSSVVLRRRGFAALST